jgi:type VI protein secretion system component Hcp
MIFFDSGNYPILGNSKVPGYPDYIDVHSWSWAGNFNPENLLDVTITKSFDNATVPLLGKANSNERLTAQLFDVDPSSNPATVIRQMALDGVTVQQIDVAGGSAPPSQERVTLRYNHITFWTFTNNVPAIVLIRPPPPTPAPAQGE